MTNTCHRCGKPLQIRKPNKISKEKLNKAFYYSQWFYCANPKCKTTHVMPRQFRVHRDNVLEPSDLFNNLDPHNPHDQLPGVNLDQYLGNSKYA